MESRARRDDQGEILGVNARKKLGAAIGLIIGPERSRGGSQRHARAMTRVGQLLASVRH